MAFVISSRRPFIPHETNEYGIAGVPAPVARIIESCWAHEPDERPSFAQVSIAIEAAALELQVQMDDWEGAGSAY
jgi:hypothetical protein